MGSSPKSLADPAESTLLPAQIAKAALKRLVVAKLEPTPENYARAYQQETGVAAPAAAAPDKAAPTGEQLAELIARIVSGVERKSRQWTAARKKDSLQRVLEGSRGDANRLQQRLRQLVASWDSDTPEGAVEGGVETAPAPLAEATPAAPPDDDAAPHAAAPTVVHDWNRIVATFDGTVRQALPAVDLSLIHI